MCNKKKTALRAAVLIHEHLAGRRFQADLPYLPEHSWNNIQRLQRQVQRAQDRGWFRAAKRLADDLTGALRRLQCELENAARAVEPHARPRNLPRPSDIYRDVLALDQEFDGVEIDLPHHEVFITTDAIELEGIYLGPFEIRLDWQQLGSCPQPYRVVALDPHPAAKSDDITHPHVQDEQPCEGEGRAAIAAALAECRLYDFFLMVSRLLDTYGCGSAYVELDDWYGVPCEDCGGSVDEDNRYWCQRCDSTLCSGCAVACQDCGEHYCSGCLSRCAACDCEHCSSCLEECPVCRKRICEDCREGGLCRSCHQQKQKEDRDDDPSKHARSEPVTVPA